MKPLELKIKGINSFRAEQTIDFRRLGEYSLFGIFGSTGSGKSSILDAIILALYGVVPRAGNSAAGIINQMEDAAEVTFRFELATAEGRQEYLVQRRYRRDRSNPDSARFVSGRLARVIESEEKVLASKDSELKTVIAELLGLSAQDFTRAVVLPQGRFAEFLALKGRERTDMLERIFALEQFGEELNRNLKIRLEKASSALDRLQSEMNGIGDASNEALELARQEMELAGGEAAASEEEEKAARQEYENQCKVWELQEALEQAVREMQQLQSRSDEMEHISQLLGRARRAEEARPFLEAAELLQGEMHAAGAELQEAAEAEIRVREEAEKQRVALNQAERQWQEKAPLLNARLEKLREVIRLEQESGEGHQELSRLQASLQNDEENLLGLCSRLDHLENRKNAGETDQEVLALEREKLRVEPELRERVSDALNHLLLLEKAQQSRLAIAENLLAKEKELVEHEQALTRASQDYEALQQQIGQAEHKLENTSLGLARCMEPGEYTRQQYVLVQLEKARNLHQQTSDKIDELRTVISAAQEDNRRLVAEVGEQEAKRTVLQEALNILADSYQHETNRNMAAHLAGLLEPGQTCPVCGALEHPRLARAGQDRRDDIEKDIALRQAELISIEEILSGLNTKLGAVQASLGIQESLQQEGLEQWETGKASIAVLLEQFPEAVRAMSITEIRTWLEQQKSEYDERLAESSNLEQALKELERDRGLALAHKEKQTGIVAHSRQLLAEIWTNLDRATAEENELVQLFTEKAQGMDPAALHEQERLIKEKDKQAGAIEKNWQSLISDLQKTSRDLEQIRLEAGRAEQALALKQANIANRTQTLTKLDGQIREVTGGEPARAMMSELEQELQGMEKILTDCRQQGGQSDRRLETAIKRLSVTQTRNHDITERCQEATTKLDGALKRCDFASTGDARTALTGNEEMMVWEIAIRGFEDQGKGLTHQIHSLQEQLQGLSLSREQWESGRERLGQASEARRAALQREGAAHNRWQDLQQKNVRWQAIEDEKGRWQEQNGRLQMLQSILRGKDFVKYIAGERLRYICQSASLRLQQLSRSRYALELDSDNNFVIRDDHNGSLRRAVSTLSGGETFLASLALALALSAQIQLHGQYPLEFFFLDEGFGTLDPELLETVMNSLESLHHERFMVGIISHVPELKNRLPRHLQVTAAEPGVTGTLLHLV